MRGIGFRQLSGIALVAALVWVFPAHAATFEDPPVEDAATVLGALAKGPDYTVDRQVQGDGLMRFYVLQTGFGPLPVNGDGLLRQRISELQALQRLKAMSQSKVFLDSLGKATAAPLRFGADLLTDPAATTQKTFSGVANMFGRIGAGLSNNADSRDTTAGSVLGIDSARRALAVRLGVDPYTDFEPLAAKLGDVARAAALGGLTMKGLMVAIPGGAGMAVSSASTAETMRSTLTDKSAAQIVELVTGQLRKLNVRGADISSFVQNRFYSPADLLRIATALSSLNVRGTELFVSRAGEADGRDVAVFQRERAELLAKYARPLGIGEFVAIGGFPLNRLDDRLLAVFPLDNVVWTDDVAGIANRVTQFARQAGFGAISLYVTGTISQRAATELAELNWSAQPLP